ncbi:methyl-accepting chemotaxis protein [Idiomarina xiamenensis]|uniref:Methyl-accepting chemotaxis protein n=1 Tax=Idiomarina xiamenensis 10-D-4 TaxID=740709 RepID=K2KK08_9GAMM|nr:methyl-accepting chemotaxis protein [Idiomarina xiamenensis]EKE87017.1 methyl-accepting chemotaxis protein [Idiomarina xiamenensis 10-D-4]
MGFLNRLTITQRLIGLLLIAAFGTGLMVVFVIFLMHSLLVDDEARKLDAINDMAVTIVHEYQGQVEQGALTQAEAQQQALQAIDGLRYENNEYLFTLSRDGVMLQHPFSKQLIGKNVLQQQDPHGVKLFQQMVDGVVKQPRATVEYQWQKGANKNDIQPKLTRVVRVDGWPWIIGTGKYQDNMNDRLLSEFWKLLGIATLLAIPLLALFLVIIRSITLPLNHTISALRDIGQGEGDLTVRLDERGHTELAQLGQAFNHFVVKIQDLIRQVQQAAAAEQTSAVELNSLSRTSQDTAEQLASNSESVATAVNELSSSAQEVAEHARQAAESAQFADEESGRSAIIVRDAANEMESLSQRLDTAKERFQLLEDGSEKIGNILSVIVGIAEQTNLLALNAAIEAGGAGEAGRGFAVVADEVRTLATRTQTSTDEISNIIERIQNAIGEVGHIVGDVSERAGSTTSKTLEAETAISQIQEAVANISAMNLQIANATDEQSRVTGELSESIVGINDLSQTNTSTGRKITAIGERLRNNCEQLAEMTGSFKTE